MTTTRVHLLSLALAAAIGTAACAGTEADTAPVAAATTVRSIPVRTGTVETRDIEETLSLTGTLFPRAEVTVPSEVGARLEQVLANEGDSVARGQLLAVLDDTDFRLARDRAKASVDVAEANRVHALAEQDRADSLLKTGGITDKDHLAARLAVQVSVAAHAQAASELAIVDRQLSRARISAPIAGRVAKRFTDAGTMVAAGTPLYALLDDSVFELRTAVASGDLRKLRIGDRVVVTVDALPGFETEGQVARITPQVEARGRSFEAIIRLPGRGDLVSGLFARASVRVRTLAGTLVVPPNALVRDGADQTRAVAYVVANGKAERRDLTVGVEVADAVQVTAGLKAGEVVIIDPPSALGPGTPVDPQGASKTGA